MKLPTKMNISNFWINYICSARYCFGQCLILSKATMRRRLKVAIDMLVKKDSSYQYNCCNYQSKGQGCNRNNQSCKDSATAFGEVATAVGPCNWWRSITDSNFFNHFFVVFFGEKRQPTKKFFFVTSQFGFCRKWFDECIFEIELRQPQKKTNFLSYS